MVEPWNNLNSTLLFMKWLMVDPWKDTSWTSTRAGPCKYSQYWRTLLDFQSLFISQSLGLGYSTQTILFFSLPIFFVKSHNLNAVCLLQFSQFLDDMKFIQLYLVTYLEDFLTSTSSTRKSCLQFIIRNFEDLENFKLIFLQFWNR